MDDPDAADLVTLVRCAVAKGWALFMATAHLTVSIQHYSSTGVRVKFLSIQHYYFFLEHEKFQLIDYKKISSIQLFFIYTTGKYGIFVIILFIFLIWSPGRRTKASNQAARCQHGAIARKSVYRIDGKEPINADTYSITCRAFPFLGRRP